jgi:hypothetical protein
MELYFHLLIKLKNCLDKEIFMLLIEYFKSKIARIKFFYNSSKNGKL